MYLESVSVYFISIVPMIRILKGEHGYSKYELTSEHSEIISSGPQIEIFNDEVNVTNNFILLENIFKSYSWTLHVLPLSLFKDTNVKQLVFNNTELRYLHPETFQPISHSLEKVSMDRNLFDHFPFRAFVGMSQLQELNIQFQRLATEHLYIPSGMGLMTLSVLNFTGNKMKAIELFDLGNLQPFNFILDFNMITGLDLKDLRLIEKVSAKHNQIETISKSSFIKSSSSLRHPIYTDNNLDDRIWECLAVLIHLETLDLSHNGTAFVDASVINVQSKLKYLDLSRNLIKSFESI